MKVSGYAYRWGLPTHSKEWLQRGAFKKTLAKLGSKNLPMFAAHAVPIGKWTTVREDDIGLYVEGEILEPDVAEFIKKHNVTGLSISFRADWKYVAVDGIGRLPIAMFEQVAKSFNKEDLALMIATRMVRGLTDPEHGAKEVDLREISVVDSPNQDMARILRMED